MSTHGIGPGHPSRSTASAVTGVLVAALVLAASGRTLPLPPDLAPDRLLQWCDEVGPTTAAMTALRLLGAILLGWMVLTAVAGVAVRRLHLTTATRLVDRLSLPVVRRFANGVAGVALVAGSFSIGAPAGAQPSPTASEPVVVMRDLGPATPGGGPPASPRPMSTTTTSPSRAAPAPGPSPATDTVTMRRLDPPPPPATTAPTIETVVIRPGDTLWHVAERAASVRAGRPSDPSETLAELDRIVAVNADRLVVPGNADLVLPGQEFILP